MSAREAAASAVEAVGAVGQRLALGTGLLLHGAGGWLAPEDSGKRFLLRSGGCLVGVAFFGQLLARAPHLIVAVPIAWAGGAWRAAGEEQPTAPKAPAAEDSTGPSPHEREELLLALAEILADRSGIHLLRLHERLADWPAYAELDAKQLRALLDHHGVPVHQSVTADGVRGRSGIKRVDVERLLTPTPPPPAPAPLETEEEGRDQQLSSPSPLRQKGPEGVECTGHEVGDDTLAMLSGGE